MLGLVEMRQARGGLPGIAARLNRGQRRSQCSPSPARRRGNTRSLALRRRTHRRLPTLYSRRCTYNQEDERAMAGGGARVGDAEDQREGGDIGSRRSCDIFLGAYTRRGCTCCSPTGFRPSNPRTSLDTTGLCVCTRQERQHTGSHVHPGTCGTSADSSGSTTSGCLELSEDP